MQLPCQTSCVIVSLTCNYPFAFVAGWVHPPCALEVRTAWAQSVFGPTQQFASTSACHARKPTPLPPRKRGRTRAHNPRSAATRMGVDRLGGGQQGGVDRLGGRSTGGSRPPGGRSTRAVNSVGRQQGRSTRAVNSGGQLYFAGTSTRAVNSGGQLGRSIRGCAVNSQSGDRLGGGMFAAGIKSGASSSRMAFDRVEWGLCTGAAWNTALAS